MLNLTGLVGRIAYAILAGIVAFLVVFVIGVLIAHFGDATAGNKVEQFAGIIGVLVAIVYFFAGPQRGGPVV